VVAGAPGQGWLEERALADLEQAGARGRRRHCHLQKNTIPSALKVKGHPVSAGDKLGLAGNTGNSTNPHTHVQCQKGSALRGLPSRDLWVTEAAKLDPPSPDGPWVPVAGKGVPLTDVVIYPLRRNPEWRGWQDLGGTITSAPAVSSWAAHRLDCFAEGTDNQLYHKWWDGSTWHNWQKLGGTFKGDPAAVSWGPNRIDVFVRGTNDHLMHKLWNGSAWSGCEDLGGVLSCSPAVASWAPHRLDVFATDTEGQLRRKAWNGSKWLGWDWVGGEFHDRPAAVSWGEDRIDVFIRGMDDHLGHLWRN
jgi:hypothetical protein